MGNASEPRAADLEVWDPAKALLEMKQEQDDTPDSNALLRTEERFRERAPLAADAILHIMQHSTSERLRLDAAKYIVERALGKVSDGGLGGGSNPLEALLAGVLVEDARRKGRAIEVVSTDTTRAPEESHSDAGPLDAWAPKFSDGEGTN